MSIILEKRAKASKREKNYADKVAKSVRGVLNYSSIIVMFSFLNFNANFRIFWALAPKGRFHQEKWGRVMPERPKIGAKFKLCSLSLFRLEFLHPNLNSRPHPLSRFHISSPWGGRDISFFTPSPAILFNNWRLFTLFSGRKRVDWLVWHFRSEQMENYANGPRKYNCFPVSNFQSDCATCLRYEMVKQSIDCFMS